MSRPCENCGADLRTCKDCIIHDGYVPLSVIKKIKTEIRQKQWYWGIDNTNQIIGIIDDAIKEVNNNV